MLAIVIIGDEILNGQVDDENLPFMIQQFSRAGYPPREVRVIRDDTDVIATSVSELLARYTYVVTAGGVGPTHDDVTHSGIARAFGVPLERNAAMMAFLSARHKNDVSANVARMAMLPQGSEVLGHEDGRWPIIRKENCFMLPGLPQALRDKIPRLISLLPRVAPAWVAAVYLDAEEVLFAHWLDELQQRFSTVTIGSYPVLHEREFKTRVSITSESRDTVCSVISLIEAYARPHGWFVRADNPRQGWRTTDGR